MKYLNCLLLMIFFNFFNIYSAEGFFEFDLRQKKQELIQINSEIRTIQCRVLQINIILAYLQSPSEDFINYYKQYRPYFPNDGLINDQEIVFEQQRLANIRGLYESELHELDRKYADKQHKVKLIWQHLLKEYTKKQFEDLSEEEKRNLLQKAELITHLEEFRSLARQEIASDPAADLAAQALLSLSKTPNAEAASAASRMPSSTDAGKKSSSNKLKLITKVGSREKSSPSSGSLVRPKPITKVTPELERAQQLGSGGIVPQRKAAQHASQRIKDVADQEAENDADF